MAKPKNFTKPTSKAKKPRHTPFSVPERMKDPNVNWKTRKKELDKIK